MDHSKALKLIERVPCMRKLAEQESLLVGLKRMLVEERVFLAKRAPVLGSGGKLGPVQDQITAQG